MQAVAKTPHIEFSFKGPKEVLFDIVERLKGAYPVKTVDSKDWFETDLYKKIKARVHGGTCLRTDLFNAGVSQKVLAEATGIPQPHISQMISGKRPINPANAAKFAKYFNRPAKRYRVPPSAA
jgi:predicted XRE-type DNA-binding protein